MLKKKKGVTKVQMMKMMRERVERRREQERERKEEVMFFFSTISKWPKNEFCLAVPVSPIVKNIYRNLIWNIE